MKTRITVFLAGLLAGGNLLAADIEATLYPGQTTNTSASVTLPSLPPAADVLFSFDVTSSMGGVLDTTKSNALTLMASLEATGVSFRFGVSSFGDYPATYNSCGYSNTYGGLGVSYPGYELVDDYPYRLDQALTTNHAAVAGAIGGLKLTPGIDGAESYTRALYETYADTNMTWRSGASRIVVNFGDNIPHDCNLKENIPGMIGTETTGRDPGRDAIVNNSDDLDLQTVLHEMATNNVVLLAARVSTYAYGDYYFQYWTNWTSWTGGKAFQSTNVTLINDLRYEITNSLAVVCVDNLHPIIEPASFISWLGINPPAYATICSGEIRVFNLALTAPAGTPAGDYSFTLRMVDDKDIEYVRKTVVVHVSPTVPLPIALNNSELTWETPPETPWFGQTNVSHDTEASGRSYFIGHGQQSVLTTTTNGPATLSFWWRTSSQANADTLSFLSYGGGYTNLSARISGETDWQQISLLLPGGPQTLVWTYTKDGFGSAGMDAGFLDQVSFLYGPTLPYIITNPVSRAVVPATPVSFSVVANGTPFLSYQWRHDGTDIAGATSTLFSVPSASGDDAGNYSVRVYNPYGEIISADALLTVFPLIVRGDNSLGQIEIPPIATNLVAIASAGWHNLGLRANGTIVAWGDNYAGQCDVPPDLTNALAVAAGGYHNLAIRADGTVAAWGANEYGQCNVPANLGPALGVGAGTWHSLALRLDGTVRAWGENSWGQCNVPLGLNGVQAVAAAGNHSLALRTNGIVVAWGDNTDADGYNVGQSLVPAGLTGVVAIAAGEYHSLAVRSDGTVVAWGDNSEGQSSAPAGLNNVVAVAGGGAHSLALKADGTVVAWGNNWYGQCNLPLTLTNVMGVAAGSEHTVLLAVGSRQALRLLNPVRTPNTFTFLLQTLYRRHYALDYKESLSATNWTTVATSAGNGGLQVFTDPAATAPQRYYRLRQW